MRVKPAMAGAVSGLVLAACGASPATATVNFSGAVGTLSIVVTAPPLSIITFENGVKKLSFPGVTTMVMDGDHHTGPLLCQADATSKDGETGHIAMYSTIPGTPTSFCDQMKQSIQSA